MTVDPIAEAALFDVEQPPPVSLADKFGVPPFSVLDARQGEWQDRKRRWLSVGIQSEVSRDGVLGMGTDQSDPVSLKLAALGTVSIFDPVVCELVYRWLTREGAVVLDPFAGGSVRGVVASILGRYYYGIELRPEQVAANRDQAHLGSSIAPTWEIGDAIDARSVYPGLDADLVFSCPPYADLEVYSDNPSDLSTMPWPEFRGAYREAIAEATSMLRPNRFAAWVISDVRDKRTGLYRGLVYETVEAFAAAGLALYNDAVLLNAAASAGLRAERPFVATRKLTRTHQHLLIFVKGDPRAATDWINGT